MRLEISSAVAARLIAEAEASADREICGLLFGSAGRIDAAEPCANVARDPSCRFEIDPVALFTAHRRARAGGMPFAGCYHSHPSGASEPSVIDAESAMGDGAVWLIIGRDGMRAWCTVAPGRFEPMVIRHI